METTLGLDKSVSWFFHVVCTYSGLHTYVFYPK
jgi:hypothetical protein